MRETSKVEEMERKYFAVGDGLSDKTGAIMSDSATVASNFVASSNQYQY